MKPIIIKPGVELITALDTKLIVLITHNELESLPANQFYCQAFKDDKQTVLAYDLSGHPVDPDIARQFFGTHLTTAGMHIRGVWQRPIRFDWRAFPLAKYAAFNADGSQVFCTQRMEAVSSTGGEIGYWDCEQADIWRLPKDLAIGIYQPFDKPCVLTNLSDMFWYETQRMYAHVEHKAVLAFAGAEK